MPGGVNLVDYGGNCNGSFDNLGAINRGLTDAKAKGVPLVLPAGQCNVSDVIHMYGAKMVGQGASSVLYATNYARSTIFFHQAGVTLQNLTLSGPIAPERMAPHEYQKITVLGATDFVIDGVTINGSGAAGMYFAYEAARGRITNNVVRNTRADSIHMTDGTNNITLENNRIENSGDDGIAAVSYDYDAVAVHDITARNNVIMNNLWGRNMAVVGGANVLYSNNYLEGNAGGAACVYVAQEGAYSTKPARNVTVEYNTMKNCGSDAKGHGAIMAYSSGTYTNDNLSFLRNDIIQLDQPGIVMYGPNTNVRFEANRINGASPATSISTSGVTVSPYVDGRVGYVKP